MSDPIRDAYEAKAAEAVTNGFGRYPEWDSISDAEKAKWAAGHEAAAAYTAARRARAAGPDVAPPAVAEHWRVWSAGLGEWEMDYDAGGHNPAEYDTREVAQMMADTINRNCPGERWRVVKIRETVVEE